MADFCTVTDVEAFLMLTITGDAIKVSACGRAITEASEAIRNFCQQTIDLVTDDAITLDVWSPRLPIHLPELPVVSVASVVEDDEALVEGRDEDYMLAQYGQLRRMGGGYWAQGPQILIVTYTHGYATIPDDIEAVCVRASSRAYQAGLRAAEDEGVMGITAKALGDFSASYGSGAGGGVGEGLMGASGARMLLLSEKDMLAKYRMVLP